MKWKWLWVGLGVFVVLGAIGNLMDGDEAAQEAAPETAPQDTAGEPVAEPLAEVTEHRESRLACDHFRNIAADVNAGVLTESELREKLKEVESDSLIATPAVRSASIRMLSTITQGETDAFGQAVRDMDAACESAGH